MQYYIVPSFHAKFQEGVAPIHLIVEHELHRATPGGTGGVKTIGNYAAVSDPFTGCYVHLFMSSRCLAQYFSSLL